MILKKPYAFLIKYFKLINFIICSLAIYLAFKTYNIINFFNEYIINNYTGNFYTGFFNNYVSSISYFIVFLIIISLAVIYLLFIYKKKPTKIYLSSIIYYIGYFIFLTFIKNIMITLETTTITAEVSRIYRDVSLLVFIPQIFLILMYFVRGIGLNLQKFNFEKDLKELEIEEKDSEEVEITFSKDNTKLKRNIKRFIREFKYYLKENKFIVSIIGILILLLMAFAIYKAFPEIVDSTYNQGEVFSIGNLNYSIKDSIITNVDYKGDQILQNKYYLVIKLNVENLNNKKIKIDYNSFRLKIKNKYIYPILNKGIYFIDYATNNYDYEIKANERQDYALIYEINDEDLKENYKIKINDGQAYTDNKMVGKHTYINISPIVVNEKNTTETKSINEKINFSNSNLGNTTFTVKTIKIAKRYVYDYEYCINKNCNIYKDIISSGNFSSDKTLIVMDYEYEIDKEIPFYNYAKSVNAFSNTFMKIKYINELNEELYAPIEDVTPNNLQHQIVLKTTQKIEESKSVFLSITIRNKEYLVKLK